MDQTFINAWFRVARAMALADGELAEEEESFIQLFGITILELNDEQCVVADQALEQGTPALDDAVEIIASGGPAEVRKAIIGLVVVAQADRRIDPGEVDWARLVGDRCGFSESEFGECCRHARLICNLFEQAARGRRHDS